MDPANSGLIAFAIGIAVFIAVYLLLGRKSENVADAAVDAVPVAVDPVQRAKRTKPARVAVKRSASKPKSAKRTYPAKKKTASRKKAASKSGARKKSASKSTARKKKVS